MIEVRSLFNSTLLHSTTVLLGTLLLIILSILSICVFCVFVRGFRLYNQGIYKLPCPLKSHGLLKLMLQSTPEKTAKLLNSTNVPIQVIYGPLYLSNVIPLSPSAIRQISTLQEEHFEKTGAFVQFLHSFTGDASIFTAKGKDHFRLRSSIKPALSYEKLTSRYASIFRRRGRDISRRLYENNANDECIISIRKATFEVLMDILFGPSFIPAHVNEHLLHLYHTALTPPQHVTVFTFMMRMFLPFVPLSMLTTPEKCKKELRKKVKALCNELISKQELHEECVLRMMMKYQQQDKISADELMQTVLSFLLAGQQTTTIAVSWALLCLAKHQELQQKLYDELQANKEKLGGDSMAYVTHLDNLPVLNSIVKECLRLYPPLPYTLRRVSKKEGISVEGYYLPYDTSIRVPIAALQIRKDIWGEDAETFNPYRFERPEYQNNMDQKWANCTFWFGRHGCIGRNFALIEIKVFIAETINQFKLDIEEETQTSIHIMGRDATPRGLKLKLTKRT